jgi:hypothetical protein
MTRSLQVRLLRSIFDPASAENSVTKRYTARRISLRVVLANCRDSHPEMHTSPSHRLICIYKAKGYIKFVSRSMTCLLRTPSLYMHTAAATWQRVRHACADITQQLVTVVNASSELLIEDRNPLTARGQGSRDLALRGHRQQGPQSAPESSLGCTCFPPTRAPDAGCVCMH